jgi:trans-aconitate methyltransferase
MSTSEQSVSPPNPVDLLFDGMEKLGPGGNVHSLHVLHRLPRRQFGLVVDAGCGTGRQTLALAKELGQRIHAIDSHEPFLKALAQRAAESGLEDRVQAHCMDMQIDLLWSEGAAYNIGFDEALTTWATALSPGGFAVLSELAWLRDSIPEAVRDFFSVAYPAMRHSRRNIAAAEAAGYKVLETHTLPEEAWVEGYYDVLEPRAEALAGHPDGAVSEFARETLQVIATFRISAGSYGYVFYVLQRAE